jgi:hypothetical protein
MQKLFTGMAKHEIKTLPGENLVGEFFARFPELIVRQFAQSMGIKKDTRELLCIACVWVTK